MPLKKKEEVCGKPNQYNLQTLEYDWKELPDTHIQVPQQQPRIRNYSVAPTSNAVGVAGGVSPPPRLNPITHQPLATSGAGPSYTPLPSPSKPIQEAVSSPSAPQGRHGNNNRRDNVAELFNNPRASPAYNAPVRASPAVLPVEERPVVPPPVYPYNNERPEMGQGPSRSPAPPPNAAYDYEAAASPAYRNNGGTPVIPWSHDDIRRVVTSNALEAQRSYLR